MPIPFVLEVPCADRKTITAVRIANFENWSRYRFAFGHEEFEFAIDTLDNAEQRNRAMLHRHLYRQPAPNLTVIYVQGPNLGSSLCDCDVAGTIVSHQHHIVVVVHCVILCERTSDAE